MRFNVVILATAKNDIDEAAKWYNKQQNNLGKRFVAEVKGQVAFIKENPEAAVVRYGNTRTAVLEIFPYLIHYKIDIDLRQIVIIAVLHTSRNPRLWIDR